MIIEIKKAGARNEKQADYLLQTDGFSESDPEASAQVPREYRCF